MGEALGLERITRAEEVERKLLEKIEELAGADGRLPTEAELTQIFNVSRGTVRSAVGSLVSRGFLVRRQGLGTFVNQHALISNPIDLALEFSEIISRNGYTPGVRHLSAAVVDPDARIDVALQTAGQPVLERHTVFSADGIPVIYCVNTIALAVLSAARADELIANPAKSEPIYEYLERECGQRIEFHVASIWPELAQSCGMREMICEPLTPVLVLDETGYNVARQPVLHSMEYYPGHFMRFDLVRRRMVGRTSAA